MPILGDARPGDSLPEGAPGAFRLPEGARDMTNKSRWLARPRTVRAALSVEVVYMSTIRGHEGGVSISRTNRPEQQSPTTSRGVLVPAATRQEGVRGYCRSA